MKSPLSACWDTSEPMPDYRRLYEKEKRSRVELEAEILAERDARLDAAEHERASAEAATARRAELEAVKTELTKLQEALAKAAGQAEALEARLTSAEADRLGRSAAEQGAQAERERREAAETRLDQERNARLSAERREAQAQRLYQDARLPALPLPPSPTEWRFIVAGRDFNGDIAEIQAVPAKSER